MIQVYSHKIDQLLNFLKSRGNSKKEYFINTSSATKLAIPNNSIDYIFVDPPFGGNLMSVKRQQKRAGSRREMLQGESGTWPVNWADPVRIMPLGGPRAPPMHQLN